jgi:hypothetical protein
MGACVFGARLLGPWAWADAGPRERGEDYQKFNLLKSQFPVTLSINRESQLETLRYHGIAFIKEDLAEEGIRLCNCHLWEGGECRKVPLWINPKVDSAYFNPSLNDDDTQEMLNYIYAETQTSIIADTPVVAETPDVLSAIQTLEIRNMHSSSGFNKGIMQYFTGLKTLCFTANIQEVQVRPAEASKLLEDLMPYLEQQVDASHVGKNVGNGEGYYRDSKFFNVHSVFNESLTCSVVFRS